MNTEEVQLLFTERLNVFDPILGQPTASNLTQLREELATILLPLRYDLEKGICNLIGLFIEEENYKQHYRAKFPMPTKPAVCDETIPSNATYVVQAKDEAVHTAKIADYLLFAAAKRETCDFILVVVEDTWVCKLCESVTFYTSVVSSELLYHLQTLCGGLHALNFLAL